MGMHCGAHGFSSGVHPAFGQSAGAIVGAVTDASGASIPGVEITATNEGTTQVRSAITNETGNYRIEPLQVGIYTVTAELAGFRKEVRNSVKVDLDARVRMDFRLEVGAVTEVVEVTGAAPVVQTDTSQVGQVVDERKILELPLNGRNFSALAYITPGTFAPRAGSYLSERGQFAVAGVTEWENEFILDGVTTNSPNTPEPGVRVNLDAIAEFKIQTQNYSATYGRSGGSHVDAITKSGTNEFHGSAFGFARTTALDARNFFEAKKAEFTRSQYGGVLGGPIIREKLFFFVGLQLQKQETIRSTNPTIPLPEYWEGDLSRLGKTIRDPLTGQPFPNSQIPKDRIHPISLKFRQLWDRATLVSNSTSRNARASFVEPEDYVLPNFKINYNLSQGHQISGSYTLWRHTKFLEWFHAGNPEIPGFMQCCGLRNQVISFQDVLTLSPTVVNEFRAGYPRNLRIRRPEQNDRNYAKEFGILGTGADFDPAFWGYPKAYVPGYSDFGKNVTNGATVQNRAEGSWNVADTVSVQKGNHALKIGGDVFRSYMNTLWGNSITGRFEFAGSATGDAFADFLLGYIDVALRAPPALGTPLSSYPSSWNYSLFFQDDWKASSNLTFNLGLRYDHSRPLDDKYGKISRFDPALDGGRGGIRVMRNTHVRYQGGIDAYKRLYPNLVIDESSDRITPSTTVIQPRFGFAWTPQGNTNTVVRGGYAIVSPRAPGMPAELEAPFNLAQRFTRSDGATWDNPWPGTGAGAISKGGNELKPPHTGYFAHWNLGVQREIPFGVVLDAAYVGKKGTHLAATRDINQPIGGVKPYPQFGPISFTEFRANTIYHGLQTRVERRSASGASLLVSYAWGKMISNGSAGCCGIGVRDVYNLAIERGPDDEDIRHRFSTSVVLPIPIASTLTGWSGALISGWQLSGIFRASSGGRHTPTVSQDFSGSGRRADRPNLVGNPKLDNPDPRTGWWNKAAFTLPERGTFGNAGVGVLEGPGYLGTDMALTKGFAVTEDKTFQFRWEVFNLFNHANFFPPITNFQSPDFGTIGSALPSRQMQFALKFIF